MNDKYPRLSLHMTVMCSLLAYGCGETGPADEDFGETSTELSGHLGELGDLKPTVSSLVIENSGEILIYLSSAALSCQQLTVSRWLGSVEPGAQVVEIVVPSERAVGLHTRKSL